MDATMLNFWGKSKYWWAFLLLGALVVAGGFWLMTMPVIGYAIIALVFGYALLFGGVIQIMVSTNVRKEISGWGWWLAGGIFDILIGLLLVTNLTLTEASLPYFFAFIFLFRGINSTIASFSMSSQYKYWWVYLINGLLMIAISWLFFVNPFASAFTIVFLATVMMVYWGIALIAFSFDVKPGKTTEGTAADID